MYEKIFHFERLYFKNLKNSKKFKENKIQKGKILEDLRFKINLMFDHPVESTQHQLNKN